MNKIDPAENGQLHHDNPRLQRLLHQQYPQLAYPRAESSAKMRLQQAAVAWLQSQDSSIPHAFGVWRKP